LQIFTSYSGVGAGLAGTIVCLVLLVWGSILYINFDTLQNTTQCPGGAAKGLFLTIGIFDGLMITALLFVALGLCLFERPEGKRIDYLSVVFTSIGVAAAILFMFISFVLSMVVWGLVSSNSCTDIPFLVPNTHGYCATHLALFLLMWFPIGTIITFMCRDRIYDMHSAI
jgi:hypothetical protein